MPALKDLLGCRAWRRGVVVAGVVAGRFAVTDVGAGVMGDSGDHVTDDACNNAPSLAPQAEARDVCVLAILRCARVSGLAGVTRPGVVSHVMSEEPSLILQKVLLAGATQNSDFLSSTFRQPEKKPQKIMV